MLTIVEKVLILQNIDIFDAIPTSDMAFIAGIMGNKNIMQDNILYKEGDYASTMYVLVNGSIRLEKDGKEMMKIGVNEAFGTWSLFDDDSRIVTAVAEEESELLTIEREDFIDILADHVQITQGLFKSLVKRLRRLMDIVNRR